MNLPEPLPPVACSLTPDDASAQMQEWAGLRDHFRSVEPTAGGVRLRFDPIAEVPLRAVAAKEAVCCAFLDFAIAVDAESIRLDVTSDQPDALPVIAHLSGVVSGEAPAAG